MTSRLGCSKSLTPKRHVIYREKKKLRKKKSVEKGLMWHIFRPCLLAHFLSRHSAYCWPRPIYQPKSTLFLGLPCFNLNCLAYFRFIVVGPVLLPISHHFSATTTSTTSHISSHLPQFFTAMYYGYFRLPNRA
jgi:hypothetical protein